MISLDPESRLTCEKYLSTYRNEAFPEIFYTFLHPFISSLNDSTSSTPNPNLTSNDINSNIGGGMNGNGGVILRTDADDKIERIWLEWELIEKYLSEAEFVVNSVDDIDVKGDDRRPEVEQNNKAVKGDVC